MNFKIPQVIHKKCQQNYLETNADDCIWLLVMLMDCLAKKGESKIIKIETLHRLPNEVVKQLDEFLSDLPMQPEMYREWMTLVQKVQLEDLLLKS